MTSCIKDHISAACDKLKTLAEESMTKEHTNLKTVPNASLLTWTVMPGMIVNWKKPSCQPATHTVFTVIENNSGKGKVVDCVAKNPVCSKRIALRQGAFEV